MCDTCSQRKEIGRGGYGTIVEDPDDPTMVIKCQLTHNDSPYREVLMYHWLDHPNIPKISGMEIITSQYGKEYLHFKMKKLVPLKEYYEQIEGDDTKWKIYLGIISVVTYLCRKVVHHQDIRPSNILVDPDNGTPYLIDFGLANDTYTVRAGWVDPAISEYYYTKKESPPCQMMIGGNVWSLGLLGIWLFIDNEIYDWAQATDDEIGPSTDIAYLLKGRFGWGLRKANLDLEDIEDSIIDLIDRFMGPSFKERIRALRDIQTDRIDTLIKRDNQINMDEFNDLDTTQAKKDYVLRLFEDEKIDIYIPPPKVLVSTSVSYNAQKDEVVRCFHNAKLQNTIDYVKNIRQIPIRSKEEAVKVMRDILDATDSVRGTENKVKLVYLIYDDVLPKCYGYISSVRFWTTCIFKLEEFEKVPNADMSDLVSRRMKELEEVRDKYTEVDKGEKEDTGEKEDKDAEDHKE